MLLIRRTFSTPSPRQRYQHCFTLIEMLAAMAIFVVIMFALFRFMVSAQQVWSMTNSSAEVYNNARIAMDLIGRDLQGAVARSNDWWKADGEGKDITFDASSAKLLFVTVGEPASKYATSNIIEVGYRLDPDNITTLQRRLRDNKDDNWGPYGDRDSFASDPAPEPDEDTGDTGDTDWQDIIDAVIGLEFTVFNPDNNPLPDLVQVELTLLDRNAMKLYDKLTGAARDRIVERHARTFTRTFFLGGRF